MIKLLLDKVAVRAAEETNQTESGIVIAGNPDKDKPRRGEVVAIGPGRINEKTGELDPTQVAIGDTVVFGHNAGVEVDTEEGKLLVMVEAEILAVIA